ncbi:MAG TPA: S9 family peptidase, partial [Acidobacteriota bacterium]
MKKAILAIVIIGVCCLSASAQTKRKLSVNDYFRMQEISDPQLSPDRQWVAFSMYIHDAKKDDWNQDIYMVPFQGGDVVRVTSNEKDDLFPRWSPDDKYLGFLSKRKGRKQVFLLPRSGGEAMQLTDFKGGVSAFSWSPDSKKLALVVNDPDPDAKNDE